MTDYNVVGFQSLTIDGTARKLTAVTVARSFVGRLETAQVRGRGDGNDPTSSEGVLIEIGDIVVLSSSEIDRTAFIRTGSTSGILKGHFYSAEPTAFSGGGFI